MRDQGYLTRGSSVSKWRDDGAGIGTRRSRQCRRGSRLAVRSYHKRGNPSDVPSRAALAASEVAEKLPSSVEEAKTVSSNSKACGEIGQGRGVDHEVGAKVSASSTAKVGVSFPWSRVTSRGLTRFLSRNQPHCLTRGKVSLEVSFRRRRSSGKASTRARLGVYLGRARSRGL